MGNIIAENEKLKERIRLLENELEMSHEKYLMFFNNLTEAVALHKMITDDNGQVVDFTYEELNPAREKMIGMTYSEVKNKTVREVNPDIAEGFIEKYGESARTGEPLNFEFTTKVFNKHLKVKAFSPQYGYLATIIEDLSDQKKSEELLNKTLEKYKAIFENSVEGIVLIDDKGTINEWNKCIEGKTGLPKSYVIGKKLWDVQYSLLTEDWKSRYPADKLEKIWIRLIDTLPDNEVFRADGQFQNSDGRLVLTEDIICPIRFNGEKHIVILQLDLTDRRNAEQELKISEQKLKQLNATKDKLFSIIAHDLRSPFNAILGYSRVLRENLAIYPLEESEKILDILNSSAQKTLDLLINLLSWAKNQTGQTTFNQEEVMLHNIVQEVVELMSSSAKIKNISMNFNVSGRTKVYADKNMLKIILQNLISNAVKFTNPGGLIHISALPCNDSVEITVSDTGTGISKKRLKNLFSFDADDPSDDNIKAGGAGLGLAICREFVEKNGGRIWAESKSGRGSKFKFTCPFPS
jgi:PAS domain S-box-containing protein